MFGRCFVKPPRLWLHGYLPVDASGDFVFQAAVEFASSLTCRENGGEWECLVGQER